jgi:hypothetical protein
MSAKGWSLAAGMEGWTTVDVTSGATTVVAGVRVFDF